MGLSHTLRSPRAHVHGCTETVACLLLLCCCLLQKREQSGDHWSPRFFTPAPGMGVLPNEETPEAVPLWAWNGKYSEAKQQPEVQEWEGEQG